MSVIAPVHPGKMLQEEFLVPLGISAYRLAKEIGVPANRITEIINEKRSISAETGLLLSRYFGLSDGYWIRWQALYDSECARDTLGDRLGSITPFSYSDEDGAGSQL